MKRINDTLTNRYARTVKDVRVINFVLSVKKLNKEGAYICRKFGNVKVNTDPGHVSADTTIVLEGYLPSDKYSMLLKKLGTNLVREVRA